MIINKEKIDRSLPPSVEESEGQGMIVLSALLFCLLTLITIPYIFVALQY